MTDRVDDLVRADAFDRRLTERMSTEVVPFAGGVAYLDLEFPRRFGANFLWVDDAGTAPVEHWIREADRILGGSGLRHRTVVFHEPAAAERMAFGFAEHGYVLDRGVLMVQRDEPERGHDLAQIEEVAFDEARPLIEVVIRREPWATDDQTVQMLTDYRGKLARTIGARFFVARIDGRPAGCCELYVDGDEAQVESVDTLQEFRGRGLASAFVLRAAAEGRAAGAEWVHLWADADDWPQRWYARLGFREVARAVDFMRWPDGEGPTGKTTSTGPAAKSPA
jgi:N-acetylglutamate synthase-like GNAT family acetyltransferase